MLAIQNRGQHGLLIHPVTKRIRRLMIRTNFLNGIRCSKPCTHDPNRPMKLTHSLKILWLLCVTASNEPAQQRSEPSSYREWIGPSTDWKVEMNLDAKQYQVGKKFPVKFVIRNITDETKKLIATYAFKDYWIEVKTEDGQVVPYTEFATRLRRSGSYSIHDLKIAAGAESKGMIDLADYFQLTKPGDYRVSARRHYSWSAMDSNWKVVPTESSSDPKPVTLTIVP